MKAIIIDDEIAVRNGLLKYVHWNQLGIREVVAVDTAEKAMKYIEKEQPELVVSDIRLPNKTGIELGQWIRDEHYDCRIVFISAYSEREYMKKAIVLSAEDYIDKPISIEQVETTVRKVVQKILEDKEKDKKRAEAENVLSLYFEQVEEKAVSDLLKGKWNDELMSYLKKNGHVVRKTDYFICLIAKCERTETSMEISTVVKSMEKLITETEKLRIQKSRDIMVYLLHFSKEEYMVTGCQELEKLKTGFPVYATEHQKLFIAVSEKCTTYKEIPEIYFQAGKILQRLFFYGYNQVCFAASVKQGKEMDPERIPYEEFRNALLKRENPFLLSLTDRIYEYMAECTNTLPDIIRAVYYELNNMLLEVASGGKGDSFRKTNPERNVLWTKINAFDTIQQCSFDLKESINLFLENEREFYSENETVNRIAFFIKNHYDNSELSVKDIADAVYLTPAYMTVLFKAKTGVTVGQLIKTVRLENAMVLLRDTHILMKDVSDKCGYSDQNYFTKVFKKEYGITPTEYREKYIR